MVLPELASTRTKFPVSSRAAWEPPEAGEEKMVPPSGPVSKSWPLELRLSLEPAGAGLLPLAVQTMVLSSVLANQMARRKRLVIVVLPFDGREVKPKAKSREGERTLVVVPEVVRVVSELMFWYV